MTDADFRKLVLLADVRATMNDVNRLLQQLIHDLHRCAGTKTAGDPFYEAARAAEAFELSIIDLREVLGKQIMAVAK